MERRTCTLSRPRLTRDASGKPRSIQGYAAVFYNSADKGTEYELARWGGYRMVERLLPGCFDRCVREDDVRAMFNHDANLLLGRTTAGTCKLSVDGKGLRYEITPPDTTYARDLLACLDRGDVSGSSFSFTYLDTSERQIRGPDGMDLIILEVRDVLVYDVGPVVLPAYTSTTAAARKAAHPSMRLTPERARRRADEIEAELAALDRQASGRPRRLSRRERARAKAAGILEKLKWDDLEAAVLDAREQYDAGRAARRRR